MMDKNFFINMHRAFVIIRSNIAHSANEEVLCLIKNNLESGEKNSKFLVDLSKSPIVSKYYIDDLDCDLIDIFLNDVSLSIDIDQTHMKVFDYILTKAIHKLQKQELDQVYDLIDAFHVFPELVANDIDIDYSDYFDTYVKPLNAKYGIDIVKELLDVIGAKPNKINIVDRSRRKNAITHCGNNVIVVDKNGKILDGHYRVNHAIENNLTVDVQIGY